MKRIILLITFLLFGQSQFILIAGNDKPTVKTVSGKVIDKFGEGVAGAEIKIVETGEIIFANMDGVFNLQIDPNKSHTIQINTIGFVPKIVKSNSLGLFSELSLLQL